MGAVRGTGQEMPLAGVTPGTLERGKLKFGFDPFGNDSATKSVRQIDERVDDARRRPVAADRRDQRHVYLEDIDGQGA